MFWSESTVSTACSGASFAAYSFSAFNILFGYGFSLILILIFFRFEFRQSLVDQVNNFINFFTFWILFFVMGLSELLMFILVVILFFKSKKDGLFYLEEGIFFVSGDVFFEEGEIVVEFE